MIAVGVAMSDRIIARIYFNQHCRVQRYLIRKTVMLQLELTSATS